MRIIVVGLGVQGKKRKIIAKRDFYASVDPYNMSAEARDISDIPIECYDAALLCVPDDQKLDLINYCLRNKKHVLVEKPLFIEQPNILKNLEILANKNKTILYTAYNHRFEPHFLNMKNLIQSNKLGKIYSCRMFYGNGTAKLVRDSIWRDQDLGVISDLGSHLLDTYNYWFNSSKPNFKIACINRFENNSPDHAVIIGKDKNIQINLEMTLCMWKNHFTCDILGEKGTAHIESLCKWGPSKFIYRKRIMPSGKPKEQKKILIKKDPTWYSEYRFFKKLIKDRKKSNLSRDIWIKDNFIRFKRELNT